MTSGPTTPAPAPPSGRGGPVVRLWTLLMGEMTPTQRRNAQLAGSADAIWGFHVALIAGSTVMTVLLTTLGAGKGTIGIVGAIETGGLVLPQIIGAYFFRPRRNRKRVLIIWHILVFVPFVFCNAALTYFSGHLNPETVRVGLLCFMALGVIGIGTLIPPWMDWFADVFDARVRGRVFGLCLSASATTGAIGALVAGWLIKSNPSVQGYARHFFLAGVVALIALLLFYVIRDPEDEGNPLPPPPEREAMLAHFFQSLRDANFRAFLVGRMLATLGFSILPFIAVHFTGIQGGSLSSGFVVSCAALQGIMTSVSFLGFGRLGDTRGHRLGMIICCIAQAATLGVMLTIGGPMGCLLAYAMAGVAVGAGGVAQFNLLLETCPHEGRVAHITAGNLVHSLVAIAGPLLAGWLAQAEGTPPLFAISLGFSALALSWFVFRLREPRVKGEAAT